MHETRHWDFPMLPFGRKNYLTCCMVPSFASLRYKVCFTSTLIVLLLELPVLCECACKLHSLNPAKTGPSEILQNIFPPEFEISQFLG